MNTNCPHQYELPLDEADPEAEPVLYNQAHQRQYEDRVIREALGYLESRHQPGQLLTSPEDTKAFLRLKLAKKPAEVFVCLYLDNRHRVIAYEELFQGTIDGASVHPREVVRRVIEANAAAVIFAHNHPSGVAEPSQADLRITQRLKEALALIDVRVLDHIIVGAEEATSLAERGLL
jgi:DNA repair protein RadC